MGSRGRRVLPFRHRARLPCYPFGSPGKARAARNWGGKYYCDRGSASKSRLTLYSQGECRRPATPEAEHPHRVRCTRSRRAACAAREDVLVAARLIRHWEPNPDRRPALREQVARSSRLRIRDGEFVDRAVSGTRERRRSLDRLLGGDRVDVLVSVKGAAAPHEPP